MAARVGPGLLAVLCAAAVLAACGGDDAGVPEPEGCEILRTYPSARELHLTVPLPTLAWAQEIWISYHAEEHAGRGYRFPRTREAAVELARTLCGAVRGGAEIGPLARKYSNGFGGRADGFVVTPEPSHRARPDARDRALAHAAVGELTPLLEYDGGFWFARRVSAKRGRELAARYERERRRRARARIIHTHHAGAFPRRHEVEDVTKEQAITRAWRQITAIQGGANMTLLAREEHHGPPEEKLRGGLLVTQDPLTGEPTEWIRWGDANFPQALLDVILEKCPPGTLWPEPVIHGRGVTVVKVLERKE